MNRIVRTGFTFIEIAMATLVMALALLPIFGMIQGGLVRSDISVSYSAATELASALMNQLMSDVLPFDSIPETPGGKYLAADGSVAAKSGLDAIFGDGGWVVDNFSRLRTATNASANNIQYRVDLWVGRFKEDGELNFSYLENPNIDFTQKGQPSDKFDRFFTKMVLDDWTFSPYNPGQEVGNHLKGPKTVPATPPTTLSGSAWATRVTSINQFVVTSRKSASVVSGDNKNLKKLVLRIQWSGKATGRTGLGDHDKEFWLVSFRANLGGIDATTP